jgi:radical SAM enzyme (TIGR01210 family)
MKEYIFNEKNISEEEVEKAKKIVENKVQELRNKTPNIKFKHDKLAEIEINKFFYNHKTVNRAMIVLRANGCEHYKKNGGCSMCSHFNGIDRNSNITTEDYIKQWDSVVNGESLEQENTKFNLNNYPVVCVYNLGSLLNEKEISNRAVEYIFKSLNNFKKIAKVIIESRAEYVTEEAINNIKNVYHNGIVEVGIGVESTNNTIREICHHKGLEDLNIVKTAINNLHKNNFKALAYINLKPIFLTESEAIEDAIKTAIDCFKMGFDAVSIEPTSLQDYSLANHLYQLGQYRVPWLWSVRDIVQGIYDQITNKDLDIRLGGYFDEEVLSGSQGVGYEGKNEIFPHMTSLNCDKCSNEFINCIKKFNMTYDLQELYKIKNCDKCYEIWKDTKKIKDSRDIITRVQDILDI